MLQLSKNLLLGATNAFNNKINSVKNSITNKYMETPALADYYRKNNIDSIVIGDENYGEGSSREHAAMEPRFMGVRVVLVKSFAGPDVSVVLKRRYLVSKSKQDVIFNVSAPQGNFKKLNNSSIGNLPISKLSSTLSINPNLLLLKSMEKDL